VLTITGTGFGDAGAIVTVNGEDVSAQIVSQTDSLIELRGNKKKLNIHKGPNSVTVTVNGVASNIFTFGF
jgi:hypothetical protein